MAEQDSCSQPQVVGIRLFIVVVVFLRGKIKFIKKGKKKKDNTKKVKRELRKEKKNSNTDTPYNTSDQKENHSVS